MLELRALITGADPRQLSFGLALGIREMVRELIWRRSRVAVAAQPEPCKRGERRVMAESFYIGGYWGDRRESIEECSRRLTSFLLAISEASPMLSSWYQKGNSNTEALRHQIEINEKGIQGQLVEGRHFADTGRRVIEELGYTTGMWTGQDPAAGLSVTCGAFPSTAEVMNHCVLNLPPICDHRSSSIYVADVATSIMQSLATSWTIDWGALTNHALRKQQQPAPRRPVIGWMTYLAASRPVPDSSMPPGVVVRQLPEGTLIQIGEDPAGVDIGTVMEVRDLLTGCGALEATM